MAVATNSTVRDLVLALTSKGASAVAFDVLFAEPDRTSIEAIVKLLPAARGKRHKGCHGRAAEQ